MRANSFLFYSFLAALVPYTASAGIRVGNLSRNNAAAYQQVNELRYGTQAVTTVNPIPVANTVQAVDATTSNSPMNMEKCSMIYPDGEFAMARPTLGRGVGGATTCTAVVEMRAIGAGLNGADLVIARANLAAGDSIRCNISDFPESTHSILDVEITVPADAEPTIDDVIKIMND